MTRRELDERDAWLYSLYRDHGWTLQEIADEVGLTKGGVWEVFRRHGWPRRRRGPQTDWARELPPRKPSE